ICMVGGVVRPNGRIVGLDHVKLDALQRLHGSGDRLRCRALIAGEHDEAVGEGGESIRCEPHGIDQGDRRDAVGARRNQRSHLPDRRGTNMGAFDSQVIEQLGETLGDGHHGVGAHEAVLG
ncbi:MAG: hypothetical protein OET79_11615, partial [Nitrospirota bacterium]|nr:hypothetical protein [Nitrospirota bacterium]